MGNEWADPAGYAEQPKPIAYRILDHGIMRERRTQPAYDGPRKRWFHALAPEDQRFADSIAGIVQEACRYFYADDWTPMPGDDTVVVSDDEVRERIHRLNKGENEREPERVRMYKGPKDAAYPLDRLPWATQRALIERIEAYKQAYQFEFIGPTEPAPEREYVEQPYPVDYWAEV